MFLFVCHFARDYINIGLWADKNWIIIIIIITFPTAVDRNRSIIYIYILYQYLLGLRTKSVEIFNNICSLNFKIVCLTET
jgi:hypothetical protein